MKPRRYRADIETPLRPPEARHHGPGIMVTDIPGMGHRPLWWVREHRPDLLRPAVARVLVTDDLPF
jgi:hypothetical protein